MQTFSRIATAMVWAAFAWGCGGGGGGQHADVRDIGASPDAFDAVLEDETVGGETVPDDSGTIADPGGVDLAGPDGPDLLMPPDESSSHEGVLDPGGFEPGTDVGTSNGFVITVKVDSEVPGQPIPLDGVQVTLLDNETGQPLGPAKVTDQNGQVVFEIAAGLVFGVKVAKETYVDRYQFDIHESDGEFQTGMISLALVQGVAQAVGVPWDPAKGIVVGSVGFGAEGPMEPVGCAVVSSDAGGEARYWDPMEDMPATLEKAPMTSTKNSNFVLINVAPGVVHLTAKVNDKVVATKTTRVFAAGMTSVEMVATTAENPTPAGCAY